MAKQPQHMFHSALTQAFESAERNTKPDKAGNASYGFAKTGMPISPAREASVMKAAQTSAKNRSARADARNATAPTLGQTKVTAPGGLGLNKPKLAPKLVKGGF
jgi:hypothetical protein